MKLQAGNRTDFMLLATLLLAALILRLDQFMFQVLLDDEWHAVHMLLTGRTPAELFYLFGQSDYSIPLGILYWYEAHWFGLSELAMRWPMLLAGLAAPVAFTAWAWRRHSPRTAVLFAFFLAISPMLIIYSTTARPYALTLLLSYLGLHAFFRYSHGEQRALAWGAAYCIMAPACVWLHPVTGPFLVAPFLLEGARGLRGWDTGYLAKLAYLAVPFILLTAILVLPPLLANFESLTIKAGRSAIDIETLQGVWFMWLGSPSGIVVSLVATLGIAGLVRIFPRDRLVQYGCAGLALTAAVILLTRPAWASNPGTFGRYLLPAIPLLLLGAATAIDWLLGRRGVTRWPITVLCILLLVAYLAQSPVRDLVSRPNSHKTHSLFQADFRPLTNPIARYQQKALQQSPFWASFASQPPDSLLLAVAPFYFETYHWDGPRWERQSRQRIVPAFLTGFCMPRRFGEVPRNSLYRLRNAYYLSELETAGTGPADWVVFTKPLRGFEGSPEGRVINQEAKQCLGRLRVLLGVPDYEDRVLAAYRITGGNH